MRMMAHLATALALLLPVAPALAQQAAPPIEYEIFTPPQARKHGGETKVPFAWPR